MVLVCFVDILDRLEDFLSYNLPFSEYLLYYLYLLPTQFFYCMPISVLLASIRLFRAMAISNEYTALITGGISLRTILFPILMSCVFLSVFGLYLNQYVEPRTWFLRKLMENEKFKAQKRPLAKNINTVTQDGRKCFIGEYDKIHKKIRNFMISETQISGEIKRRILAEKMVWKENYWEADQVTFQTYQRDGTPNKPDKIDAYIFKDTLNPAEILLRKDDPKFFTSRDLKRWIEMLPESRNRAQFLTEYYRKIALSFLPLIMLFIAVPFGLSDIRNVSSKSIGIGVVLSLIYYIVDALFYQAGQGELIPPLLAAWSANILFGIYGLYLLRETPR
jgi:lipopolysaccharide export system permease protein